MNHIKVQLKPTGGSEYPCSQYNECVTAMKGIHLLVESCAGFTLQTNLTKHQQRKGIEAWKYYRYNHYQGYNHVPNIVLSVNGLSASQLMTTIFSGDASQLLNVPRHCRLLNVSMSRYRRTDEKNHCRRLSRVSTIIATSLTMLSKTRTEILTSDIQMSLCRPWRHRRSFPVPIFRRVLPHHAT